MKYTVENTADVGRPVRVFLDGSELHNAIEADTKAGYVIVTKLDARGHLMDDGNGDVQTERRTGKVVVLPKLET